MKTLEISQEVAAKLYYSAFGETLDVLFDTGFQNEFDIDGNPEDQCVLHMREEEARKYVVDNSTYFAAIKGKDLFLYADNEISGFGQAEDTIFDVESLNLTDEEMEDEKIVQMVIDPLIHIIDLANTGDIYHNVHTGEEWLGIGDEGEILIGKGSYTDWGEFTGGDISDYDDRNNPKNWKPQSGVEVHSQVSLPDDIGTYDHDVTCFVQKDSEVNNPVNESWGWLDDFILLRYQGKFSLAKRYR